MRTYIYYGDFSFDSASGYPVPNFSIAMSNNRSSDGAYLSSDMLVTLDGVVYTQKMTEQNAVSTSGTTSIVELFTKASGLKTNIIANNNTKLIIGCGSQTVVASTGSVKNISFSENANHWAHIINYSIEISIPLTGVFSSGEYYNYGYHVSNVQDSYRLEAIEDQSYWYGDQYIPAYRISRTLGATGKSVDSKGALYQAKEWIRNRESYFPITSIFKYQDFPLYNQTRNVSVSETDGTYTITDTFISKSGAPYIVTENIGFSIDSNYRRQIEINGKVQGLQLATALYAPGSGRSGVMDIRPEVYPGLSYQNQTAVSGSGQTAVSGSGQSGIINMPSTVSYKYANAVSGYSAITGTFYNIALIQDQILQKYTYWWHGNKEFPNTFTNTINPIPVSVTEGFNPTEGSISYNFTYNNRPLSLIPEALSETINIRDSNPVENISEIFVIGRRLGPVILSTTNALGIGVRTVTYEGVFPRTTGLKGYSFPLNIKNNINNYIYGLRPSSPEIAFLKEDTETLNLTENRLSRTVSWEYSRCNNT